ncbi:MAG: hypothetical protein ACREVV_00840 [Steroidobacteraceae bacterium]
MNLLLSELRKRRNWLALLVLPALLFRAAIPVGFMPMVSAGGGVSIEFCPGQSGQAPSNTGQHHAPCLFAASAGGAPAPAALELTAPAADAVRVDRSDNDNVFLPTIVRTQTSRGPPARS